MRYCIRECKREVHYYWIMPESLLRVGYYSKCLQEKQTNKQKTEKTNGKIEGCPLGYTAGKERKT